MAAKISFSKIDKSFKVNLLYFKILIHNPIKFDCTTHELISIGANEWS